jgi:hypothetical protein
MNDYIPGTSLASRNISAFPLSIGTSLSMESLFSPELTPYDPSRVIPNIVRVSDYQEIWINVETLFRNIISAVNKEVFINCNEEELKDTLLTEMEVINGLFMIEGKGLCKPMYYYCTRKGLVGKYHVAVKLREDKTEGQKMFTDKFDKTIKLLIKQTDEVRAFDYDIRPLGKSKAMIMTHIPYDLLSYKNFTELDLLESNTGKLKKKYQWNSKYFPVGDADLSILPFTRKFLLVFGDKVLLHAMDMRLRKSIVEVAHARKWTALSTEDKVMLDLSLDIREPYVVDFLRKL